MDYNLSTLRRDLALDLLDDEESGAWETTVSKVKI